MTAKYGIATREERNILTAFCRFENDQLSKRKMRNRKVYQLLALLGEEEQLDFMHYLNSPLLNKSKAMIGFYQLWRDKILGKDGSITAGEFLSGSKLKVERMDKYCSLLSKLVIDFLSLQHFLSSSRSKIEHAADALEEQGAPRREWELLRERLHADIRKSPDSSEKFVRQLDFKWKEAETRIHTRETRTLWKEDFRGLHESLDQYFYLQKLKLACASANIRLIYKQDEDPGREFIDWFQSHVIPDTLGTLPRAYWLAWHMVSIPEETDYFVSLFALLKEYGSRFSVEEERDLFNYALNYCLRLGNQGDKQFMEYSAALYRELLARKIILDNEKLPSQAMKNIVVVHCIVGELDWVESFLRSYEFLLPEDTDPNLLTYNQAVLAFYRENYGQAIDKLQQVISQLKNDIFYELDSRTYLLKAYFEYLPQLDMEGIDEMYRMYDSFRMFIERNKQISEFHKLRYGNFIREFRRFLRYIEEHPLHTAKLKKLYEQVEGMEYLVNKSWFLEKLEVYIG